MAGGDDAFCVPVFSGDRFCPDPPDTLAGILLGCGAMTACLPPSPRWLSPLLLLHCAGSPGFEPADPSVEIGLSTGDGNPQFSALTAGTPLTLQTFGQGGRHLLLAVRTRAMGSRAFVSVRLQQLPEGAESQTTPTARPALLYCELGDDGPCDLMPFLVPFQLVPVETIPASGLPVALTVTASTESGLYAEQTLDLVLHP